MINIFGQEIIQPKFVEGGAARISKDDEIYQARIIQTFIEQPEQDDIFAAPRFKYLIEYYIPIDDNIDTVVNDIVLESELLPCGS